MKSLKTWVTDMGSEIATIERSMTEPWSDGLPIVPPTTERVAAFLDHVGMAPDQEIARYRTRDRAITAEEAAVHAVIAGCKAEYMPLLIACLEGVMDPEFHVDHLLDATSPWPIFVVNGPVVDEISLNNATYVMGPGRRANMTIGRAISLTLAKVMDLRPGGAQRGVMGSPARAHGLVIGEREDSPWEPLSAMLGLPVGTSTVTVMSTFEGTPKQIYFGPEQQPKRKLAEATAHFISYYYGEGYVGGGTHLVVLPPITRKTFLEEGWSKQDLRRYLLENTRTSVASLKRRFLWPAASGEEPTVEGSAPIHPGDEQRFVHPGRETPPGKDALGRPGRKADFLIMTSGSDVGHFHLTICNSFPVDTNPVVRVVRQPAKRK